MPTNNLGAEHLIKKALLMLSVRSTKFTGLKFAIWKLIIKYTQTDTNRNGSIKNYARY